MTVSFTVTTNVPTVNRPYVYQKAAERLKSPARNAGRSLSRKRKKARLRRANVNKEGSACRNPCTIQIQHTESIDPPPLHKQPATIRPVITVDMAWVLLCPPHTDTKEPSPPFGKGLLDEALLHILCCLYSSLHLGIFAGRHHTRKYVPPGVLNGAVHISNLVKDELAVCWA